MLIRDFNYTEVNILVRISVDAMKHLEKKNQVREERVCLVYASIITVHHQRMLAQELQQGRNLEAPKVMEKWYLLACSLQIAWPSFS